MTNSPVVEGIRRQTSEILKRVDQLIRSAEIDQAVREVIHAKEIDPTNAYIYAYEERLAYLKAEHEKHIMEERTKRQVEEAARRRDEQLRRQKAVELQRQRDVIARQEEERQKKEQALQSKIVSPSTPSVPLQPVKNQMEVQSRGTDSATQGIDTAPKGVVRGFAGYQVGGGKTVGRNNATDHSVDVSNTIVVIDDDEDMLHAVAQMLTVNNYEVKMFSTSDEALKMLKTSKPRLILSDIDLGNSAMGGFTLFGKLQEMQHLRDVPFIFISGLADDVIIRKGKEIGVDDYLVKPVSEEELLAAVKGKLKRYARFQGS